MKLQRTLFAAAAIAATLGLAGNAHAGIIYNTGNAATATVALGVNTDGSLNVSAGNITENASATGLAFKMEGPGNPLGFYDATAPGCLCEGWGVSATAGGTTASGGATRANGGNGGLVHGPAGGVADVSVITTSSLAALPGLSVRQEFAVSSATSSLFEVKVTITNATGADASNVRYTRVMDWDVPFTEFDELVTIKGTGTTTLLERSHNDGFSNVDPLETTSPIAVFGCSTDTVDFTDCGPEDHGAYFKFNFGDIADGESYTFSIFYGAAASEREALTAVGAAGIELYSFGQSNGNGSTGTPATFIFGFAGVGGTPVEPNPVSAPGTLALAGLALVGLGAAARRRRAS